MGVTFNPQILMEKLTKLNSSQQSIETFDSRDGCLFSSPGAPRVDAPYPFITTYLSVWAPHKCVVMKGLGAFIRGVPGLLNNDLLRIALSHWCIFHMNKAKQVVETWDKQYHYSPREQRLAFLYLANDILQNSRRKGSEFVDEFWKVLPDALRDVVQNGDEPDRNAALRLVTIWEERKVIGSRGQILKEELVGKNLENINSRNEKDSGFKLRQQSTGNALDQIVSGYQIVHSGQHDEGAIFSKCRNAISCIEKVDKEIGGDINLGKLNGSGILEELQGHHALLKDCIGQLTAIESSRANLVSHLRETLQDQEFKLDQVRNQLQEAQSQSEQADNLCRQLLKTNPQLLAEQSMEETHTTSKEPHNYIAGNGEQPAPVMYTRQYPFTEKSGVEDSKATAAAVADKLTASTSSAQMLTYVLSSLASEGVIGNPMKESSGENYPSEKRTKLEHDHHSYIPLQNPQPPVLPDEQPPPPSSPPPLPPLPPMHPYPVPQYGSVDVPYFYPASMAGYPTVRAPINGGGSPFIAPPPIAYAYQSFQG